MVDYSGFKKDPENTGWVKGWLVFDDERRVFHSIHMKEEEAASETEKLGKPYAYSYGAHLPNTDEYILDSYTA